MLTPIALLTMTTIILISVAAAVVLFLILRKANPVSKVSEASELKTNEVAKLPAKGLLVTQEVLQSAGSSAVSIREALESSNNPVAIAYQPITEVELTKYRTVPVNASVQKALVEIVKAVDPRNPTLYTVVIPRGMQLVKAVGKSGFRGFSRSGGKTAQAILKPVGVASAAAVSWPVVAVAGAVMTMDALAQREQRAFQNKVEALLGRQEERYYADRITAQRSADAQLSRAINLMLDGQPTQLELAVKLADDEFHRAQLFLEKYGSVVEKLVDETGKVDYRELETALGGKDKDVDNFVRELHLSRASIAIKRKALVADAASVALADPTNPYASLRKFMESQAQNIELAEGEAAHLAEQLSTVELKGRWHDKGIERLKPADKKIAAKQKKLRAQIAAPVVDQETELNFIMLPNGEIMQAIENEKE